MGTVRYGVIIYKYWSKWCTTAFCRISLSFCFWQLRLSSNVVNLNFQSYETQPITVYAVSCMFYYFLLMQYNDLAISELVHQSHATERDLCKTSILSPLFQVPSSMGMASCQTGSHVSVRKQRFNIWSTGSIRYLTFLWRVLLDNARCCNHWLTKYCARPGFF